ncbi:MAG: glycosyltransferase [Myxococcota bacterium]|jgi:glycosyltransferase involved in cell wall biosynthesis|nr:glycosyltransferase [Myxococcota bacterium]
MLPRRHALALATHETTHDALHDATTSRSAALAPPAVGPEWLHRVGLINDYVRIPYANGSSFASQFLFRELRARGHEVTVVGPRDPDARPEELPPRYVELPSLPLRNHPGVHLAMPSRTGLDELARQRFDLVLAQTSNALMDAGVWLRTTQGVPLVLVNTVHLPSVYNAVLPERLNRYAKVHEVFQETVVPFAEAQTVDAYNRGDGLVVLSAGLEAYWRRRGVRAPIHVIPRAIEPKIFSAKPGDDPFDPRARRGQRLLVVCRHVREKSVQRLLGIFAHHVLPACPDATLTLVGDGPDHALFVRTAEELGIADRTFFVGEQGLVSMPTWYAHADLFVYASLSETYGQVVTEAAWCGLPAVAFSDEMGVSGQIVSGVDGELVSPGPHEDDADVDFGARVVRLLREPLRRRAYAIEAARRARLRADPGHCVARYYDAFEAAREHARRTFRRPTRPEELGLLSRWTGVHAVALGLGLLRAPAVLNRNHAATPAWTL